MKIENRGKVYINFFANEDVGGGGGGGALREKRERLMTGKVSE